MQGDSRRGAEITSDAGRHRLLKTYTYESGRVMSLGAGRPIDGVVKREALDRVSGCNGSDFAASFLPGCSTCTNGGPMASCLHLTREISTR